MINNGSKMSKSLGNGVNLGEQLDEFGVDAVRLTLVFAGPPEDDIDWADDVPGRVAAVPAAGLAAQRRRRLARRAPRRRRRRRALRRVTARTCTTRAELVEAYRFNVMVARVMELVNATRKAIDSGCGPADPAVREAAEGVAMLLCLVAPYTAEEMWERLGHEPAVARVDLARRRPGPAGRGRRHRRRPDPGQGPGPPGGRPRTSPRPTWRRWHWPTRTCCGRWTAPRCARSSSVRPSSSTSSSDRPC